MIEFVEKAEFLGSLSPTQGSDKVGDRGAMMLQIQLTEDLERFVNDAVLSGRYAREDDVIRDALLKLRQTMPTTPDSPARKTSAQRLVKAELQPVTPEELNRRLLASGLVIQLPTLEDYDDDDVPIDIQGESLSETIISERG